jgi:hypothetical protein
MKCPEFRCILCGNPAATPYSALEVHVDHLIPLSNLQALERGLRLSPALLIMTSVRPCV